MRCRSCCMLCRAKTSSVSQVGLDAATPAVLFSFMGGVSFPGVSAPVVRWSTNRRLHRLLFVYTPIDVTSGRVKCRQAPQATYCNAHGLLRESHGLTAFSAIRGLL